MTSKIWILPLILITIAITATAAEKEYFGLNFYDQIQEDFEYPDTFSAKGWTYSVSGGCGTYSNTPIYVNITKKGFGIDSNDCGLFGTAYVQRTGLNITDATRTIYDFSYMIGQNNTNSTLARTIFMVKCGDVQNTLIINQNPNNTLSVSSQRAGGATCTNSNQLTQENNHTSRIILDVNPIIDKYSLYVNGDNSGCSLVTLGSDPGTKCQNGIHLSFTDETGKAYMHKVFPYVQVWNTVPAANQTYPEGYPCSSDADCVSGKCYLNQCVLSGQWDDCTYGYQCISNICIEGKCGKASISQLLNASKNELFGSDNATANIISVIIIIMSVLMIIYFSKGNTAGIIAAGATGVMESFFFAFIGWLSPWILLGELLVIGVVFVLAFMIKPGGD